jgi:hypothetical protein
MITIIIIIITTATTIITIIITITITFISSSILKKYCYKYYNWCCDILLVDEEAEGLMRLF